MTSAPLVSVVVPAYNAERYIGVALAGILGQQHDHLECIVVDDGSTDATASIVEQVRDPRLRLISPGRRGSVSAVRNIGIEEATGDLVAFHDADDFWHRDKLTQQVALIEGDSNLGLVWCSYVITDADLRPVIEIRPSGIDIKRWVCMEGNGIAMSSTGIVQRALLLEVGPFDERLSTSADADLAFRLSRRHQVAAVDDVLVAYRTHSTQMHLNLDVVERDMELLLRERLVGDRSYTRARANLHTRLLAYHLRGKAWRAAARHVGPALRRPDRLVSLPIEALARRSRRRVRRVRVGMTDPRAWLPAT